MKYFRLFIDELLKSRKLNEFCGLVKSAGGKASRIVRNETYLEVRRNDERCAQRSIRTFYATVIICLLLIGCSSKPIPDWRLASFNQLENYKKNYLTGRDKIAPLQFKDALEDIRTSGDLEIMSRAYLIRMSLQRAALENLDDADFKKINSLQPSPRNTAYFDFLRGDINTVDAKLLPEQYQGLVAALRGTSGTTAYLREMDKMEDPLSRLIAAGVIVQLHREEESLLQRAAETASAQGWQKALLVYLEKLHSLYRDKNDAPKAEALAERMRLIKDLR